MRKCFAVITAVVLAGCLQLQAVVVSSGLSIHYRADNVDGEGNPGNAGTTTLVNLANPGTHDGTIVNGNGVIRNSGQVGKSYAYGISLIGASQTRIEADTYQIAGGVNKVSAATWEFWMRADSGGTENRGALYGEFPIKNINYTRHYLRLEGIGTGTRMASYDEYPPPGGRVSSDSPLFEAGTFEQIVVTRDGDTMTFYKNGVQVGSAKTYSETYGGKRPVKTWFGARDIQNESFDGQFNIIRIYDAALTAEEVLQNFNAEVAVSEPTTVEMLWLGALIGMLGLGALIVVVVRRHRR